MEAPKGYDEKALPDVSSLKGLSGELTIDGAQANKTLMEREAFSRAR
jgi:hypothetical protein